MNNDIIVPTRVTRVSAKHFKNENSMSVISEHISYSYDVVRGSKTVSTSIGRVYNFIFAPHSFWMFRRNALAVISACFVERDIFRILTNYTTIRSTGAGRIHQY